MSLRRSALHWLKEGFAVAPDGQVDVYALSARVHAHPAAVADAVRGHFDVRANPNGTLTWLPRADQCEQGQVAACAANLAPLLPDLRERPRSLREVSRAIAHSGIPLAAAMLRAGLAPAGPEPDAPWIPSAPRFAPPDALAAAAAGAPHLLPADDRRYARVAAHALAARLPTHPAFIRHLAWSLFPTPLGSPLLPEADLQFARFEARTITPDVVRAVVLSSRSAWISFEEIARRLRVDVAWVQANIPLHVEVRPPRPGQRPATARRFAFLLWARQVQLPDAPSSSPL